MTTTVTVNRMLPAHTTINFLDRKTKKVVATATNNTAQTALTSISVPPGQWLEQITRTLSEPGGSDQTFTTTSSTETDTESAAAADAPTVTDASGGLWQLGVRAVATPNAALTPNPSGTDGTIAAGTYKLGFTWVTPSGGETLLSPLTTGQVLTGATSSLVPTVPALPQGVYGWNVYATADGTSTPLFKQNTTPITDTSTTLTTLSTSGANPPSASSAGLLIVSKLA